jgi:pyruvate/2-oxoglutarate dehydrogenase complex dihydrolipoamide dehydrogenase (E3) component
MTLAPVLPLDQYNQRLLENVHPSDWVNPQPAREYDLVVIGAGTAGLVVAAGAAGLGLGLKVALVERHLMGGDCLNVGCVPSKCLIRSSRVIADIRQSQAFGISANTNTEIDFAALMSRMRRIRAEISENDSVERFQKLGVDVFLGQAEFVRNNQIMVGDQTLHYKKAVIATGARAIKPEIEGLESVGYLTNENVFNLTTCPPSLAVIGGGAVGCELAQAFQRLGSKVVLLDRGGRLLSKEDSDATEILEKSLTEDGIQLVLNAELLSVTQTTAGKIITYKVDGKSESIAVDQILVGAGRSPNWEGLNLAAVGVVYHPRQGVVVNDYLQTTNPQIYAAGDICMDWKFTHAADAAARIVIKNTLFSPFGIGRSKVSNLVMPWVTYTSPEIAHVGISEQTAKQQGVDITTIKIPFTKVDRAIADGETTGFVKIHHQTGSDRILGATIVATHAGEMISEITTAIAHKIGLSQLSSVIHPYPTQAEAIKKAADAYRRTLLTPQSKFILGLLTKFS